MVKKKNETERNELLAGHLFLFPSRFPFRWKNVNNRFSSVCRLSYTVELRKQKKNKLSAIYRLLVFHFRPAARAHTHTHNDDGNNNNKKIWDHCSTEESQRGASSRYENRGTCFVSLAGAWMVRYVCFYFLLPRDCWFESPAVLWTHNNHGNEEKRCLVWLWVAWNKTAAHQATSSFAPQDGPQKKEEKEKFVGQKEVTCSVYMKFSCHPPTSRGNKECVG